MTLDVSAVLPYGDLEQVEVYFEHDGPRFFALRSTTLDVRLIAICTDDDPDSDEVVFLYLVLAPRRFEQVRSGRVGLREAFEQAGLWEIWRVVENYGAEPPSVTAQAIRFASIADDDLPIADARLQLPTSTAPPLDEAELLTWSRQSMRTVAAIELDADGENLTEFPLRGLGLVGTTLQETVDALAQEESGTPTDRGAIPRAITDEVQLSALALRAASFVLVVGTNKRGKFMDNSPRVESTLTRLVDLIEKGPEPEALVNSMRDYGARARGKFTNLLRAVSGAGSGIGVVTAPQSAEPRRARMTATQVLRALATIDLVEATIEQLQIRRGVLTGSNTRLGTFELVDMADTRRYSGKVAQQARDQIDGLQVGHASFVSAELLEEIDFAAEDQETGRKHTLISIQPLIAD